MSRRAILAAGGAAALSSLSVQVQATESHVDELQDWIVKNAIAIRSVDPADDDDSDLESLAAAIGTARVVQLGEPSHGAGTVFAAKARLLKFLHQRLGFDLLIWESGLYDVSLAQAGMRGGDSAVAAARRGIFTLWTEASETQAVFEYVKASQSTQRPIEMAGFDLQITANESLARYGPELREFCAALRDAALRDRATSLAVAATDARRSLFASRFTSNSDFDVLTAAALSLRTLIQTHRADFEGTWGATYTSFMDRTIGNMRADAAQRLDAARTPATTPERESRRDELNADNVRWLLNERYPGRKAVIWAHNVHVMKAWYSRDFRDVHLQPGPRDMKPTGVFLSQWLGQDVYTIGFTAYEGSEGLSVGGPVQTITPAPNGSLEARLHALKLPFFFLDLRSAARASPIRRPMVARLPKFESSQVEDVSRVYDGIFYIERISHATRV